jgi:ABC-2 type transport system permease protein
MKGVYMYIQQYFTAFCYLLLTDLKIFKKDYYTYLINMIIWASTITLVFTYLMPSFGLETSYSTFMISGLVASGSTFTVFPSVMMLINDIEGDRIISYYLTLPIPASLVLLRSVVYYTFSSMAISWIILPYCKFLAWNRFDLSNFSLSKFILIFIIGNMFYGSFTLFLATCVPSATKIGTIWMRILYPMWFLGGFQFSWDVLYKQVPLLAVCNLCNPFVYLMEGTRAAIMGQQDFISFWICCLMLLGATFLFCLFGIVRMKKRLDCI